ncbi:MAG: hypothetical protein ACRDFX_04210, partial [Chloroflexota bacterium]
MLDVRPERSWVERLRASPPTAVLSHEDFEVTTDPQPGAGWTGQYGSEIGDKCAWRMGPLNYDGGKANHY